MGNSIRHKTDKIRLLLLASALDAGGAERQLVALAKALDKDAFEVTVCLFYERGPLLKDLENQPGIDIFLLNKKGRWDLFSACARLIKEFRRRRIQAVYSFLPGPNIYAIPCARLAGGVKVIWGVRASDKDLNSAGWFARMFYFVEKSLSGFPHLIVSNSQAGAADVIARGFPQAKVEVIHNGIDAARFVKNAQKGRVLREKWGAPEGCTVFGVVASLRPMKGHRYFLEAAQLVSKQEDDVRFVCVGPKPGPARREFEDLAVRLDVAGKVIWAGPHSDMPAVYGALDVLVSSSVEHEGFSNSIGEAMSCSLPCVVTDVGDSALIVGDCGIAVPPRDSEKLARGMLEIRKRIAIEPDLCQKNRSRIQDNFDVSLLADRTAQAVRKVLGKDESR
ncbi:Glycosyltransferase involved in cell wall bisynthesis [Desulfatibacillum alkenivorans DSM 16219]|uniref:Glycosyltransferase involved in cell wall bisynthesis n=1 Tax=Desulfatibacillum alkenivorans DSM 16219 TaxID=1121393 RepID=A0A1M6RYC5_9BACT|nr:Glycosyltransferase involved in cell wall bisynthesis [Desulfatibacillum alkenivorans DSM 16219]